MYDFAIEANSGKGFHSRSVYGMEEEYDVEVSKLKSDHSLVQSFFEKNIDVEYLCAYTSRLKAGTIECRYIVFPRTFGVDSIMTYENGLFEDGGQAYAPEFRSVLGDGNTLNQSIKNGSDFEISNGILLRYVGEQSSCCHP